MKDGQIEVAAIPEKMENTLTSCPRLKSADNAGSLMTNVKDYVRDFIDAPMENHKFCFKMTFQKMVEKVKNLGKKFPKEGEKSAPVQGGGGTAAQQQSKSK